MSLGEPVIMWIVCSGYCSKTELELDLNEETGNYRFQVREEIYNLDSGILQSQVGFQKKESILSRFFWNMCRYPSLCITSFQSADITDFYFTIIMN